MDPCAEGKTEPIYKEHNKDRTLVSEEGEGKGPDTGLCSNVVQEIITSATVPYIHTTYSRFEATTIRVHVQSYHASGLSYMYIHSMQLQYR